MKEYIVKADHLIDGYGMQAVGELIRCKDCKYQEVSTFFGRKLYGCELAEGYSHVCLDDDFCSRAERRTDNG